MKLVNHDTGMLTYITSGRYQLSATAVERIKLTPQTVYVLISAIDVNVYISPEEGAGAATAPVMVTNGNNLMMPVTGLSTLYVTGSGTGSVGIVQFCIRGKPAPIIKVIDSSKLGDVTATAPLEPVMNIDSI